MQWGLTRATGIRLPFRNAVNMGFGLALGIVASYLTRLGTRAGGMNPPLARQRWTTRASVLGTCGQSQPDSLPAVSRTAACYFPAPGAPARQDEQMRANGRALLQ